MQQEQQQQLPELELDQYRLQVQDVEVTSNSLGSGTHADVVEVRYMGLTCVAKSFHFVQHNNYRHLIAECRKQCYQHCRLLGKLRHPNLVQFIGLYEQPSKHPLPVFVYESLHMTLAACIAAHGVLPDSVNYSILKDVAMALRYLHEHAPPISHRSLTASKVLLTRDMTAKLSDVGVTSITEVGQHGTGGGTGGGGGGGGGRGKPDSRHLPAIVVRCSTEVEVKHDVYAYGMLMVHVVSGKTLLSELRALEYSQSLSISEPDLVEALLGEIRDDHVLLDLIERCLKTDPQARPSAITVLHRMTEICGQHPPLFTNSLEMLRRIKDDAENQLSMTARLKTLSPEASFDCSQSEVERLRELVSKISAQNVVLQARLGGGRGSLGPENGEGGEEVLQQMHKLHRQSNHSITSPLHVSQRVVSVYCMPEGEI